MHATALRNGELFFESYAQDQTLHQTTRLIDVGAQDVNGTLRSVCPSHIEYVGVDFQAAKGVDVVLENPYQFPFEDEYADIVVSSSCFEHSEMFWLTFLEILRVLKPHGLFYLNAPSTGGFHQYPVDCWRYYPDSGKALIKWSAHNGINAALLESYTQVGGTWQDFVAVFIKNESCVDQYPRRILHSKKDFENGYIFPDSQVINFSGLSQNDRKLNQISAIARG